MWTHASRELYPSWLANEAMPFGQVHGRGLSLEGWVRGDDDFLESLPGVVSLFRPLDQLADLEPVWPHAVDR